MDVQTLGLFLTQLNGLEILGIGVAYLILNNGSRLIWNRYKKKDCHYNLILKDSIDRAIRIFNIKEYETLKKQMIKVDIAVEACFDQFILNYVELLREKYGGNDIEGAEKDLGYYEKICEHVSKRISIMVRNRIKENYILDRTDEEFRAYAERTTNEIVTKTVSLLDNEYNSSHFLINRPELKEYNKRYFDSTILPVLNDMWLNIRMIASRAKVEVEEIENEFKN